MPDNRRCTNLHETLDTVETVAPESIKCLNCIMQFFYTLHIWFLGSIRLFATHHSNVEPLRGKYLERRLRRRGFWIQTHRGVERGGSASGRWVWRQGFRWVWRALDELIRLRHMEDEFVTDKLGGSVVDVGTKEGLGTKVPRTRRRGSGIHFRANRRRTSSQVRQWNFVQR